MARSKSSIRRSNDASKARKPRQQRIAYTGSIPKVDKPEISADELNRMKQVISDQEFESQIANDSIANKSAALKQELNKDDTNLKLAQLMSEKAALETKVKNLEETNEKLEAELANQSQNFLQKIKEKTDQAQKLVDEKIKYYEKKKDEEVANIRLSVFEDVASAFLEPIILLQSIVNSSPSDPVIANYLQGFKMLLNQFDMQLNELGVDEINVEVGDAFNELYMEAFDVVETNEYPPNTVVKVLKKGFVVNETKVLKHTLVVVSK